MLALTDEALALVAIAAGRVPHRDRARWLRTVADSFSGDSPSPAARRQKRYRERRRAGRISLRVAVDLDHIRVALAGCGDVAGMASDVKSVERAVEHLLRDWAAAWVDRAA